MIKRPDESTAAPRSIHIEYSPRISRRNFLDKTHKLHLGPGRRARHNNELDPRSATKAPFCAWRVQRVMARETFGRVNRRELGAPENLEPRMRERARHDYVAGEERFAAGLGWLIIQREVGVMN